MVVASTSGMTPMGSSDVFIAGAPGVAALDTPQSNQTKSEIRTLIAEIADLSTSASSIDEFIRGALPRICSAMGATAAAVWSCDVQQHCSLLGQYRLADELIDENSSSAIAHQRVLACVAAEGSPVLVPPGSTRLVAERPTNPLEEALLVVPIRILDRVDTLLEVIQPASGGPAAQRGYLRFVAQMADLLSDYLRRDRLRSLDKRSREVNELKAHLLAVSRASSKTHRHHCIAKALAQLLSADMVIVLSKSLRSWKATAVSELPTFDPRSEIVAAACRAMQAVDRELRITSPDAPPGCWIDSSVVTSAALGQANTFLQAIGAQRLLAFRLNDQSNLMCLVGLAADLDTDETFARARELVNCFGALAEPSQHSTKFAEDDPSAAQQRTAYAKRSITTSLRRLLTSPLTKSLIAISLLIAAALFPMKDQISAVCVLEAANKQLYYAPCSAIVEEINVDSNQTVEPGSTMIRLVDRAMNSRIDELQGQRSTINAQLEQDRHALLRGSNLAASARDELESRIEQWRIKLKSIDQQLSLLSEQAKGLTIVARQKALVTTWDARNRLSGRPVSQGQLLLSTCEPEGQWQLRVSIPEHQLGQLEQAMSRTPGGLRVQYSLSSHPSDVRVGRLMNVQHQLVKDDAGHSKAVGLISVDAQTLPLRNDGAVARASIDCGQTTLFWLVVRDAYREADRWVRMMW